MDKPLILLCSRRPRVSGILAVGLSQGDYRVVQADSSYQAIIKACQYLPDLVIVDITADHPKDAFVIPRLRKTARTATMPILLITPAQVREATFEVLSRHLDDSQLSNAEKFLTVEYPFRFADLQKQVRRLVTWKPQEQGARKPQGEEIAESQIKKIAHDLFDMEVGADAKLRAIESTLKTQWVFPFTVVRAMDIIESSASCCNELGKCISSDPGATAEILKVANTVRYAKRTKTVSDISEAVVRLGFRETRSLLACLALIDLTPDMQRRHGFSRHDFWLHSLSTGLVAEHLCLGCGCRRPELAFIAGLIHDLGKIPLDNNFSAVFDRLLEETANRVVSFRESEEPLMGFTHAHLGHYLTNKWNFPSIITSAILYHHSPDRIVSAPSTLDRTVQEAVYVANILSKATSMGHSCDEFLDDIPGQMLHDLRIPRGLPERFLRDVSENLGVLCENLGVSVRSLAFGRLHAEEGAPEILVVLGKALSFHPITLALSNNGFRVQTAAQYSPELHSQVRVVVSVSEKDCPLDLTLDDEESPTTQPPKALRVFLLDNLPGKSLTTSVTGGGVLFMSRSHLDLRLLLHTLDAFLDKVVVPQRDGAEPRGQ